MQMTLAFTKKSFAYFDAAARHPEDTAWFEAHRERYTEHVELPLTHLTLELKRALGPLLPGIDFSTRKISKPIVRQKPETHGPVLRTKATAFFSEPATSMFEMNPGMYISLGAQPEDNVLGWGIYQPSSRQMQALRPSFYADHQKLRQMLRALEPTWGGLAGERYKRFPRDYDEAAPGAEYLWHKQFFLSKSLSREEYMAEDFIQSTVAAFEAAVPLLGWMRRTVGVYRRPAPEA